MNSPDLPVLRKDYYTSCMGNLDKLSWVAGFAEAAYGVNYGVRVNDPDLIPLLKERLPLKSKPSTDMIADCMFSVIKGGRAGRTRNYSLFYWNHNQMMRSHNLDEVLDAFESYSRLAVGSLAPDRVFVHAGVVEWRGRAILIPGRSYSGKTTLVTELVKAGATYMSDEYAIITKDGLVESYPKPLSVRNSDGLSASELPVEDFGGSTSSGLLPVDLVVVTNYKKHAKWRPKVLTPGHGMLALLNNTLSAQRAPEQAMEFITNLLATAEIIKSARGDATETSAHILRRAERRRVATQHNKLAA